MHTSGKPSRFWETVMGIITLIRLPNLIILALIEWLLRICVIGPFLFNGNPQYMSTWADYALFMAATIFLAAGGYVINDYFDVRIDRINKPNHVVVSRTIASRIAIKLHITLSSLSVLLGIYLAWRIQSFWFGLLFPCLAFSFWFYSTGWKHLLVWKNLIVALLAAVLIFLVWLFEFLHLRLNAGYFAGAIPKLSEVSWIFLAYGCFAFLVTLFREIIKDMEDIQGDRQFGTRSIPSVIGIPWSKALVVGAILVTMGILGYCQLVILRFDLEWLFWYLAAAVQLPALILIIIVLLAARKPQFRLASGIAKAIMLTGILSMLFLRFSP